MEVNGFDFACGATRMPMNCLINYFWLLSEIVYAQRKMKEHPLRDAPVAEATS